MTFTFLAIFMTFTFLANFCLFIVGGVFFLTGIAKVLEPWKFLRHIAHLRLISSRWIVPISLGFIAFETALGVAIILQVFPHVMIGVSLIVLIGLSLLTYWSTSTGKTEDCGCYNGWLEISPTVSLLLNAFYGVLLIIAWVLGHFEPTVLWQELLTIITLLVSGALASGHLEYLYVFGRPYLELTPLQVNRQWQSKWLEHAVDVSSGSKIVVFLGTSCPQCKNWLKVLKLVHHRPDLPDVVGVVSTETSIATEYAKNYTLNFPIVAIKPSVFSHLVMSVPTAAVLSDGVIKEKWVGVMPPDFGKRISSGSMAFPKGTGQVLTAKER
jgi:hypothetical protein